MADRLLSNFGHDILDALFWTATEPRGRKREHLGTVTHLVIAIIYVSILTLSLAGWLEGGLAVHPSVCLYERT